jgi:predicted porin
MKKTLLAAALLAGFAGAASAQSSVTLYGIVDVGVLSQTVKSGSNFGSVSRNNTGIASGQQSGSRWGLKGVEDLGNGLSANFVYEAGVDVGNGTTAGNGFARQSTLGVVSKSWGAIDLGRRTTPGTVAFSGIDPFGQSFGTASLDSSMGMTFARYSNMLMYSTPNISGFSGNIGYSFDTGANNNGSSGTNNGARITNAPDYGDSVAAFGSTYKTRAFGLGLRYGSGPLVVAGTLDIVMPASFNGVQYVAISSTSPTNKLASYTQNAKNVTAWNLGATYDFKVVKVHAAYGQNINGLLEGTSLGTNAGSGDTNSKGGYLFNQGARTSSWMLGLSAPVGASGKVFLSWQQMMAGGDFKNYTTTAGKNISSNTQNVGSIGYSYSLSKRTNLYAYYSYMSNVAMITGAQSNSLGVGVRHLF